MYNLHSYYTLACRLLSYLVQLLISFHVLISQAVVSKETGNYDRWVYLESNEPMITKLQANWKGYMARKAYKQRLSFIKEQLPAILRIQVSSIPFRERNVRNAWNAKHIFFIFVSSGAHQGVSAEVAIPQEAERTT